MAYSDDAVKTKLNALNETQDSIVTVAQWIMFHRRHAARTAALWHQRLQESPTPAKRLTLVYLANEVVQQSRARSKTEFLVAFEPIVSEATALAYKSASSDIRDKLRRVVEVWRQRNVFDRKIQDTTEQRLREIDQQRAGKGSGGRLGGSLFGGSATSTVPAELDDVAKNQTALSKSEATASPALQTAKTEYEKITDPEFVLPAPPVHAHRLRELEKTLAVARGAVEESIKVRKELLSGLEKLVESHKSKLAEEEKSVNELATQFDEIRAKKAVVEDALLQAANASESTNGYGGDVFEAPEVEGFTPPAPEAEGFTPPPQESNEGEFAPLLGEDSAIERSFASTTGAEAIHELPPELNEPPPAFEPPPALAVRDTAATAANSFLENLGNSGLIRQASNEVPGDSLNGGSGDPRLKRRKMSHHQEDGIDEDILNGAAAGLDEEGVSAMLSGGGEDGQEADLAGYGW